MTTNWLERGSSYSYVSSCPSSFSSCRLIALSCTLARQEIQTSVFQELSYPHLELQSVITIVNLSHWSVAVLSVCWNKYYLATSYTFACSVGSVPACSPVTKFSLRSILAGEKKKNPCRATHTLTSPFKEISPPSFKGLEIFWECTCTFCSLSSNSYIKEDATNTKQHGSKAQILH